MRQITDNDSTRHSTRRSRTRRGQSYTWRISTLTLLPNRSAGFTGTFKQNRRKAAR